MEIFMKRTDEGFKPLYDSDWIQAKKIPVGSDCVATFRKARNLEFHKKFFALLNMAFDSQEQYKDFETFRFVMQMRAGHYDLIVTHKGKELFKPKSISFEAMDQHEFEDLFQRMIDAVCECSFLDPEEIEANIIDFM